MTLDRLQEMDHERTQLTYALLLSLLIHLLLLSLTFDGQAWVGGLGSVWRARKGDVPDVRAVLVPPDTAARHAAALIASPTQQTIVDQPAATGAASAQPAAPAPTPGSFAVGIVPGASATASSSSEPASSSQSEPASGSQSETVLTSAEDAKPAAVPEKRRDIAPPKKKLGPSIRRSKPAVVAKAPSGTPRVRADRSSETAMPSTPPDVIALERSEEPTWTVPVTPTEPDVTAATSPAIASAETASPSTAETASPSTAETASPSTAETASPSTAEAGETVQVREEQKASEKVVETTNPEQSREQREMQQQEAAREEAARAESARLEAERQEAAREAAAQQEIQRQEAAREEAARAESARLEVERQEAVRQAAAQQDIQRLEVARQEAARQAAAQQEVQRQEAAREEAARAESARLEAERQEAERQAAAQQEAQRQAAAQQEAQQQAAAQQEAQQQAAAQQEATRAEAARQQEAKREERLRAIGRQLDREAAQREAAANAERSSTLPLSLSTARRIKLWGRYHVNVELVRYAEAWARKIQLNTPLETVREIAKRPHTAPLVTVAIRSDGSVESVTIEVSSGVPQVDEALRRIVEDRRPYQPFQPELARDFDVIEIRRTWHFNSAVQLD